MLHSVKVKTLVFIKDLPKKKYRAGYSIRAVNRGKKPLQSPYDGIIRIRLKGSAQSTVSAKAPLMYILFGSKKIIAQSRGFVKREKKIF